MWPFCPLRGRDVGHLFNSHLFIYLSITCAFYPGRLGICLIHSTCGIPEGSWLDKSLRPEFAIRNTGDSYHEFCVESQLVGVLMILC